MRAAMKAKLRCEILSATFAVFAGTILLVGLWGLIDVLRWLLFS